MNAHGAWALKEVGSRESLPTAGRRLRHLSGAGKWFNCTSIMEIIVYLRGLRSSRSGAF